MAIQFIKSVRRGKPLTWYVYAFKGGPLILKATQPKRPVLTAEAHKAVAAALKSRNDADPTTLLSLIKSWRRSPEWQGLADGTRKTWGWHLDAIEARWGNKPIAVWDHPGMVEKVMKWRDERAATPRTADIGVTVLRELLKWGRLRAQVSINVAMGIPRLYKGADRSEIIWLPDDIERFRVASIKLNLLHVFDGLRLAAATGFRREDLVSLTWDHLGEIAVVKTALKKSRGKRRKAVVPMTNTLEALLAELKTRRRREGINTVLVNSWGRSWTGDGFGGSFNKVRDEAQIVHVEEDDDGKPLLRKKHLHDLRGTFCTLLLTECDLTDDEAARIMAWSPKRVERIRSTYVSSAAVVLALAEKVRAKQRAKQSGTEAG